MMRRETTTLKARILLYSSGLLVGLIAAMVAFVNYEASLFVNERLSADLHDHINRVLAAEAAKLESLQQTAALVASFPSLSALLDTDSPTVRDFLLAYREENQRYELIIVLDPAGNVIARTDILDPQAIPNVLSDWIVPIREAGFAFNIIPTENDVFYAAAYPARIGGTVFGFVIVGAAIDEMFADVLREATGDQIVILGNRILASTLPVVDLPWKQARDWPSETGEHVEATIGGETFAAISTTLGNDSEAEILAILLRSRDVAMAPYRSIQIGLLFLGLLATAAGIAGSAVFAKNITEPLAKLVAGVTRVGSGDFQFRFEHRRKDEVGELAQAFNRMLDQRQSLEAQMRQSQKMEAVGRLAGGVAHDFNNLLTVIIGRTEILLSRISNNHPVRPDIELVHEAGERASALTRQLLAFSRRQVLQPAVLSLNDLVSDLERMLRRLIGENIELATKLSPGLERVRADRAQLEQVVVNLVVNARDAIRDRGRIEIATANAPIDSDSMKPGLPKGRYVTLSVKDDGSGMTPEIQAHLFEPFFTTKEPGKGTGLGLSTVYGIIKQSGGYIAVESEPGQGTTFRIFLPNSDGEVEVSEPQVAYEEWLGDETILLAEDEKVVRELVCEVLENNGYSVLVAADGAEALEIAGSFKGPIDLLITDIIMPDIRGTELASRIARSRPEARILFISGYSEHFQDIQESGSAFLAKPFAVGELAAKVREILDAPRV